MNRNFDRALAEVVPHDLQAKLDAAMRGEAALLYTPAIPKKHRGVECSIDGCVGLALAKGMCNAHYIRMRAGKPLSAPIRHRAKKTTCAECDEPVGGKGGWGLCVKHYRARRKKIIDEVCINALGGRCAMCGGKFPAYVYDLHHRDPATKSGSPSSIMSNASLEAISKEVAKCDLLCANCHRIEHYGSA